MRNQMHSFAEAPSANIPRSRFDLSQNVKFTANAGKLIPFYVQEVLPGDTFDVNTSLVCRLQTLIHPIMDNMYLDTYFFFVPNRLVWDNWQHFCGEANKAWVSDKEWTVPQIRRLLTFKNADQFNAYFKDHIVDYMGIGVNPELNNEDSQASGNINALPIRAYNKIFDDWFRDENLMDPINLYTGDNDISGHDSTDNAQDPLRGGIPYDACKLHDYFTSALPQAQRGNPVSLSTGALNMPVVTSTTRHHTDSALPSLHLNTINNLTYGTVNLARATVPGTEPESTVNVVSTSSSANPVTSGTLFFPDNLYASSDGLNLGITINDLRMAFSVQRWMEKSARGGARYIEIIKTMFGVDSPDARLQRSEYLGGHRVPINIHQIVNTTETVDTPLGNTGAMSVTSDVHNDFIHSFVEHGHVIGLCVVRYKHSYPQGFDRLWRRKTIFDYYWPSFAYIGEQPIKNVEIYSPSLAELADDPDLPEKVFGYNEAWADYRYKPNRVMGEMRPGVPNTLASWTLSDYYTSQPILGSTWIKETKDPIDRAIAVTSDVADQFLFDILINNKATRPMPLYSIPGLIDHF